MTTTLTTTELESRINALRKSIDAGVLTVRHGNDSISYRSLNEMNKILTRLQAELDAANGTAPRSRLNYLRQESKGFGQTISSPADLGTDWTD